MTKQEIIQVFILSVIAIFYLIFTARYFFKLKTNIVFSGAVKTFHLIMIWIVPFLWILILKALTKTTPGSYEIEKKEEPKPFSKSAYGGMHTSN
ncbi:MAG: hypothetical protein V4685_04280 [Bacteroidota bacterium]